MSLSLDRIKKVNIPINVYNKPNNLAQAQAGIQMYNDSVNLYEAILFATAAILDSNDLTASFDTTTATITPTSGTAAIITAATASQAGVMTATQVTNLNALLALDGVANGATNLGTFSGNIISDNTTIKNALQELEIAIETAGSPTLGDILSSTLTVTGGTNKVFNSDVTIEVDPSTINIFDLIGQIDLTQLPDGSTAGETFIWDGTEWTIDTPSVSAHNSLSGIQGGLLAERYHLSQGLYTKLTASPTVRLLGRYTAGTGEVEHVSPTKSITFSTNTIQLQGDVQNPGNNYFYGTDGSGAKGWYTLSNGSVTTITATDNDDIAFTITNPTTTPDIEAVLLPTTVTAGSYGSEDTTLTLTVDANGRLQAVNTASILIESTQVSDFTDSVNTVIAGNLTAGTDITIDATDPAAIIISATGTSYTDEEAQDAVGGILLDSVDLTWTYDDALEIITAVLSATGVSSGTYGSATEVPVFSVNTKGRVLSATNTPIAIPTTAVTNFDEAVDDRVSNLLQAGTGISLVYNDVANTLTISTSGVISIVDTPDPGDMLYYYAGTWFVITPLTEVFISLSGNSVTLSDVISPYTNPKVYFNGLRMEEGSDYTVNYSSSEITFVVTFVPSDKVLVDYFTAT